MKWHCMMLTSPSLTLLLLSPPSAHPRTPHHARSYGNYFYNAAHSGLSVEIGYGFYYDQLNTDSDGEERKPADADYPDTILSKFSAAYSP